MDVKQYRKEYYNKNKERISQGMCRKVRCEACNIEVSFGNLTKHQKTKNHLSNIANHNHLSEEEREEQRMIDEFKKFLRQHKKLSNAPVPTPASE